MIAIYGRVSTEEQAKSGFSLDFQVREGKNKAGTDDVKIYLDDGYSGEFLERPEFNRLRKDVKDGIITKIICLDPDRLARKLMLQLIITDEFERRGCEIVFVNGEYAKTPEGQLFYSMRGAIAEFEKSKINERMSRGRREKARQGKVIKYSQLYGYTLDKETSQYEVNPAEAAIVKLIFDLFTKPNYIAQGINGIAKYLTEQEVPTKKGKGVWHKQVVRQILMNPTYMGKYIQNKYNTEGMLGNKHRPADEKVPMRIRPEEEWIIMECPAIVTEFQYEHAQKILGESRRRYANQGNRKYLLSGLLRCGMCSNTMTGRKSRNWGVDVFQYNDIKNTAGAKFKGCGMSKKVAEMDELVWGTVHNWLNQPEEIAAAAIEQNHETFEQTELERIERDLIKTRAARKKLIKLFSMDDSFGEDEIREELRELADKEERLKQLHENLLEAMHSHQQIENSRNIIQETLEYYLTLNPDELTFDDKQSLIRRVVKEVRVFDDRIDIITF